MALEIKIVATQLGSDGTGVSEGLGGDVLFLYVGAGYVGMCRL